MKKIMLVGLLVLVLLLAACGKPAADGATTDTKDTATAESASYPNAAKIAEYEKTILTKLKAGGETFLVYPSQSKADSNGEGFFVVGIRNNFATEAKYRLNVRHSNAHTIVGLANNIPMDEAAVSWFKSSNDMGPYMVGKPTTAEYTLEDGLHLVTIYYKVGDMASAKESTIDGNYVFNLDLDVDDIKYAYVNWDTIGTKKISVKYDP